MLSNGQRRLTRVMVWLKLWVPSESMRILWLQPRWGTRWLLLQLLKRQRVDELHHAPCCPANHYHRTRLVVHPCSCGATRIMYSEAVTQEREVPREERSAQASDERGGDV